MRSNNTTDELMKLPLPDTTLVREGLDLLTSTAPTSLVNHSLRSYLLGKSYGEHHRIAFDDEGLCLAAIFHDLGLCGLEADANLSFQLKSSTVMKQFLDARSFSTTRAQSLLDAINYHLHPVPRWEKGPEAGLLQLGTWMDLTKLRAWQIPSTAKTSIKKLRRNGIDLVFPSLLLKSVKSLKCLTGLLYPERFYEEK